MSLTTLALVITTCGFAYIMGSIIGRMTANSLAGYLIANTPFLATLVAVTVVLVLNGSYITAAIEGAVALAYGMFLAFSLGKVKAEKKIAKAAAKKKPTTKED